MGLVRIAVADDHALFRQGLISMLALQSELMVVAEFDRADAIREGIEAAACDLLLLDLQMDRSTLADLKALAPSLKIVVVTASERKEDAVAALRAGARGVVFKRFALETLMTAIHAAMAGEVWLPTTLQAELVGRLLQPAERNLTQRELEVVRQVGLGYRNSEIAERLGVSEGTIKTHLNNIYEKLNVRDRVGLAMHAVHVGIVAPHERRSK